MPIKKNSILASNERNTFIDFLIKRTYYLFLLVFIFILLIIIRWFEGFDYSASITFRQSAANTFLHDEQELMNKMYFCGESPAMQLYGKFCMAITYFSWADDQERSKLREKINEIFASITAYENFNHEINSRGLMALYLKMSKLDIYKYEARGFIWNHVTNKLREKQNFCMERYIEDIDFIYGISEKIEQLLYVEEINNFDLQSISKLVNCTYNGLNPDYPLKLKHVQYPIQILLDYAATHLNSSCTSFVIPVLPLSDNKDKYYVEFYYKPLRKKYKIYFEAYYEQIRYYLDLNHGHLFL